MKKELELKLQERFPTFFIDLYGDMKKTCMHWGMSHGAGWLDIITEMCEKIEVECNKDPELKNNFKFLQIKEKFGTLRVYCSGGNSAIHDVIEEAEAKSASTCESCGTTENVTLEGMWLSTLCDTCRNKPREKINVG